MNIIIYLLPCHSSFLPPPCPGQYLVQREADLFAENERRETPCDCAEQHRHTELALSLESQMVFSQAPEAEGIDAEYAALDHREVRTSPSLMLLKKEFVRLKAMQNEYLLGLMNGLPLPL